MNRREFVGKSATMMLLGILPFPAYTNTKNEVNPIFQVSKDRTELFVSLDQGFSFESALALPNAMKLKMPRFIDGAFQTRISTSNSETTFNLSSTDGLDWWNLAPSEVLARLS